jgi:phage/plasmid-associated DNA primase
MIVANKRRRASSVSNTETDFTEREEKDIHHISDLSMQQSQTSSNNRRIPVDITPLSQTSSTQSRISNATPLPINIQSVIQDRINENSKFEWNCEKLVLTEVVDLRKLAAVILHLNNKDSPLYELITRFKLNQQVITREQFIKQLTEFFYTFEKEEVIINNETHIKGVRQVEYTQGELREGRFYADAKVSMQGLQRWCRHTIQDTFLIDTDIKQCHNQFMLSLRQEYGFEWDALEMYVKNKDVIVQEIIDINAKHKKIITKEQVKESVLAVLNGGTGLIDFYKTQWWNDYVKQAQIALSTVANRLNITRPEYKHKFIEKCKKYQIEGNMIGSICNNVLTDMENICNFYMRQFFESKKYKVSVNAYDGIMIEKDFTGELPKVDKSLLKACCKYVYDKTNILIELAVKGPEEAVHIPQDDIDSIDINHPIFIKPKDYDKEYVIAQCLMSKHRGFGELISHNFKDKILLIDKKMYVYNKYKAIWELVPNIDYIYKMLMDYGSETVSVFIKKYENELHKAIDEGATKEVIAELKKTVSTYKSLYEKVNDTNYVEKSFKTATSILTRNDVKMNSASDYLPINFGNIIHLPTLSIRKRTSLDYFTFFCPVKYIPEENNKERTQKIFDFISDMLEEYDKDKVNKPNEERVFTMWFTMLLGYFLTGNIEARKMYVIFGLGTNGKSVCHKFLRAILKEGHQTLDSGAILADTSRNRNPNSHKAALLQYQKNLRLLTFNEADKGSVLNSSIVKSFTSGDEIAARGCGAADISNFETTSKVLFISNYRPTFDTADIAMINRMCCIEFKKVYENNAENRAYIEDLQTNYLNEFFSICARGAYRFYQNIDKINDLPPQVMLSTNNLINFNDDLGNLIKSFNIFTKSNYVSQFIKSDMNQEQIRQITKYRQTKFQTLLSLQSKYNKVIHKCQSFSNCRFDTLFKFVNSKYSSPVDKETFEKILHRFRLYKVDLKYSCIQYKQLDGTYEPVVLYDWLESNQELYLNSFKQQDRKLHTINFQKDFIQLEEEQQPQEEEQIEEEQIEDEE